MPTRAIVPQNALAPQPIVADVSYLVSASDTSVDVVNPGLTMTLPQNPTVALTVIRFMASAAFELTGGAFSPLSPSDPLTVPIGNVIEASYTATGWEIEGLGGAAGATGATGPSGPSGGTLTPSYGVAYGASSTVIGADAAVTFDLGATPYPNTGFSSVPAPGGSAFVVSATGDYEFDFYVTGTHAAMGTVPLVFEVYVNGASVARNYQFIGASNPTTQQSVVGHGILHLTAGQSVTLHNRTNTVTDSVTVTNPAEAGSDAGSCNRMFALNRIG